MSNYPLNCRSGELKGKRLSSFKQDCIRVWGSSNKIINNQLNDTLASDEHHRDFIQLIPKEKGNNSQFFGATANNNVISRNKLRSTGKCQGIFASDGVFDKQCAMGKAKND
jgi:hypothetical protein